MEVLRSGFDRTSNCSICIWKRDKQRYKTKEDIYAYIQNWQKEMGNGHPKNRIEFDFVTSSSLIVGLGVCYL